MDVQQAVEIVWESFGSSFCFVSVLQLRVSLICLPHAHRQPWPTVHVNKEAAVWLKRHGNNSVLLWDTLTPSFLSRSSAPLRKSMATSSFSSSHWMTNGSNHLKEKKTFERSNLWMQKRILREHQHILLNCFLTFSEQKKFLKSFSRSEFGYACTDRSLGIN